MLKLCDIDASGFCNRCQTQIVNSVTEEEQPCPDLTTEMSHINDDGEWDYDREDANTLEDVMENL